MIKMFKMSELPNRDTETQSEQILIGKMMPIDLLDEGLPLNLNL